MLKSGKVKNVWIFGKIFGTQFERAFFLDICFMNSVNIFPINSLGFHSFEIIPKLLTLYVSKLLREVREVCLGNLFFPAECENTGYIWVSGK